MKAADRTAERLGKLAALLRGRRSMLIVMQDNPDPDAIAAATALRELSNHLAGTRCTLTHGGTVGRAENRELVRYLGLRLRAFQKVQPASFELVAMVDTQPGTGNNPLPPDVVPQIVIDHHPMRRATRRVPFTDIRSRYGATATLLWEYLDRAGVVPDVPLATALLYGIRSDTQDLGRESTLADSRALEALYPVANKRMLGQIERGQVPEAYFHMLMDALRNARRYGHAIVTGLGDVSNADMIAEVADLLLRHERARWSLCYGYSGGQLRLSVRTQATDRRADEVARRLVYRLGTGGGHAAMAGGQVPEARGGRGGRAQLEALLRRRFLRATGAGARQGVWLVKRTHAAEGLVGRLLRATGIGLREPSD